VAVQLPSARVMPAAFLWTKMPKPVARRFPGVKVPLPVSSIVSPLAARAMSGPAVNGGTPMSYPRRGARL